MILRVDDRKWLTGRETEACSVKWDEEPVRGDGENPQPALSSPVDQVLASHLLSGSLLKVTRVGGQRCSFRLPGPPQLPRFVLE